MCSKFRTAYDSDTGKYVSETGSKYLDQYEYKLDEKGEVIRTSLHKTDKPLNVYDRIQADYDSTDINKLMLRFSLGDTSAIDVKDGIYADVTKAPKTLADMYEKVNESERLYNLLPADVKALFNNSCEEFWTTYGSEEFFDKIDEYNDRFVDHSFDTGDIKEEKVGDDTDE